MKLLKLVTLVVVLTFSTFFAIPSMADEPRFAGRGWTNDGVHVVAYSTDAGMNYITAADLALAGVDIFDQGAVFAHLGLVAQSFGGCGLIKDPDSMDCHADNGVAGTITTPEKSRDVY